MTTTTEPPVPEANVDDLLQELGVHAKVFRPRLFAVHGCYRGGLTPFLGWGMEFPDEENALFYEPDSRQIWQSSSAERVLATHQRIGTARLTWLDAD